MHKKSGPEQSEVFLAVCGFESAHWFLQETMLLGYSFSTSPSAFAIESNDAYLEIMGFYTKLVKMVLKQVDFRHVVEQVEDALSFAFGDSVQYKAKVQENELNPQNIAERFTCLVVNEYQARIGNVERVQKVEILSSVGPVFTMKVFMVPL